MTPVVEHATEIVDWLDEHGFRFDPVTPRIVYGHEPYYTRAHLLRHRRRRLDARGAQPLLDERRRGRHHHAVDPDAPCIGC